jgi:hypothetical protein
MNGLQPDKSLKFRPKHGFGPRDFSQQQGRGEAAFAAAR